MNYSNQAENALKTAKRISSKLKHDFIGTEHLLAGLLREEESIAGQVLAEESINSDDVMNLITELMHTEGGTGVMERKGYTPKLRQVLELAEEQAKMSESSEIGTEHLLLALFQVKDCS